MADSVGYNECGVYGPWRENSNKCQKVNPDPKAPKAPEANIMLLPDKSPPQAAWIANQEKGWMRFCWPSIKYGVNIISDRSCDTVSAKYLARPGTL